MGRLWISRRRHGEGDRQRHDPWSALAQLVACILIAALLDTTQAICRLAFPLSPEEVLSLAGRALTGWTLCGVAAWLLSRIATAVRSSGNRPAALAAAILAAAAAAATIRSASGGLPADGSVAFLGRLALVCGAATAATGISVWMRRLGRARAWSAMLGLAAAAAVLAPTKEFRISPGLRETPDAAIPLDERGSQLRSAADNASGSGGFRSRERPPPRLQSRTLQTTDPTAAPDIVLLTIDTWRADTLGLHAHSIAPGTAPTLERWASQGRYYSAATAPIPLTGPSHAAMLSGLLPWETAHLLNGFQVDDSVPWAPERLQAAGYRTAAFLGSAMLDGALGFARGFDVYDDDMDGLAGWRRTVWSSLSLPRRARDQRHDRWERRGERTLERVERWLGSAPPERPLFLWVHLYEPHAPYEPPVALATETLRVDILPGPAAYAGHPSFGRPERRLSAGMALLLDRAPTGRATGDGVFDPPSRYRDPPGAEELARRHDELLTQARSYLGEVRRADELASELGLLLDNSRSGRNQAWIVAGDHGESLTEHHEYASHQRHVYQANLAVPLMVLHAADRGEDSGSTVDVPVSLEGVSGTLLRLAGQDPGGFPELPTSDDLDPRDTGVDAPAAIVLGPDHGPLPGRRLKAAAWDGHYKLIAVAQVDAADAWEEWYDTRADPAETALLDPASLPADVTGRLRRTTSHVLGETQLIGERAPRDIPRSMREAMRALGYVEP